MDKTQRMYIYGLVDPRIKKVFYVGRSITPYARFGQHLSMKGDTTATKTIADIMSSNLMPELKILEEIDGYQYNIKEKFWIAKLNLEGHPLVNKNHRIANNVFGNKYDISKIDEERTPINVSIPISQMVQIDTICREVNLTKSEVVRQLLTVALKHVGCNPCKIIMVDAPPTTPARRRKGE